MVEHVLDGAPPRERAFELTLAWRLAGWWLLARAITFTSAALLQWIREPRGYFGPEFRTPLTVLTSWDGRWYTQVARNGYLLVPGHQSDPAFFPFYPALLRIGGHLGLSYSSAGILISNVVLLGGLLAFYRLGCTFLPDQDAYRAAVFGAIAPMGFTFSMVYPESIVFTAMALTGLCALRRRWLWAAGFAAVAALARPQGALLVLPLAAAAWHAWRELDTRERGRAAGAVAAPLAGLAAYPLYLWTILGDPHAWSRAQEAWGRSFELTGFVRAFEQLPARNGTDHWLLRDAIFCLVYVLLLAVAYRAGTPRGWIAAGALMVLLPLESGSFISVARFGLLALPIWWGAAVVARRRAVDWTLRIISLGLLVTFVLTLPLIFP
jgi:hypothetical protein